MATTKGHREWQSEDYDQLRQSQPQPSEGQKSLWVRKNSFGKKLELFFRALNLQNELSKELKTTTKHRISCSNCI